MAYKLGKGVSIGDKILLKDGWNKIVAIFDDMVVTNKGNEVKFGGEILGWKK